MDIGSSSQPKTTFVSVLPSALAATLMLLCFTNWVSAAEDNDAKIEAYNEAYASYKALIEKGDFRQAIPEAEKALELGEELFGEDHKNVALLTDNYAYYLYKAGDDRAEKVLKLAVERYEKLYGKESPELIPLFMNLGDSVGGRSHRYKQQKYLNKALKLAEQAYSKGSIEYAKLSIEAGAQLAQYTQWRVAEKYLEYGYAVLSAEQGDSSQDLGWAAFLLGKSHLARKNYDLSRDYFLTSVTTFQSSEEKGAHPLELSSHAFLVQVYEKMNERELATEHCLAIGRMTPYDSEQEYMPLYTIPPIYPRRAQEMGLQGGTLIEFTVDPNGFVREPRVVQKTGSRSSDFDMAAIDATLEWRYAPRFVDGKPVATENVQHWLTFKLE